MQRHRAGLSPEASPLLVHGIEIVEIIGIEMEAEGDLMEVANASNLEGFCFALGDGGQKHACENSDNCNHDEELNQGESQGKILRESSGDVIQFHTGSDLWATFDNTAQKRL